MKQSMNIAIDFPALLQRLNLQDEQLRQTHIPSTLYPKFDLPIDFDWVAAQESVSSFIRSSYLTAIMPKEVPPQVMGGLAPGVMPIFSPMMRSCSSRVYPGAVVLAAMDKWMIRRALNYYQFSQKETDMSATSNSKTQAAISEAMGIEKPRFDNAADLFASLEVKTFSMYVVASEIVIEAVQACGQPFEQGELVEGTQELIFPTADAFNHTWNYLHQLIGPNAWPQGRIPDPIILK